MRIFRLLRSERGLSLTENMMAVAIILIVLTGVMTAQLQSMSAGKRAAHAYTAYQIAKNRIETLKSFSFSDAASAGETSTYVDDNGTPDPEGNFIRSTTVTASYNGDANLLQAVVSVYYKIKNTQSAQPMQITTVLYNG